MIINFLSLRPILLTAARRLGYGDQGWRVRSMAHSGRCVPQSFDGRADRSLAGGVLLPPAGRRRLLFDAAAQPLPPALRFWSCRGANCALAGDQSPDGLASARRLFQRGDSGGAPPYGRPAPWQT